MEHSPAPETSSSQAETSQNDTTHGAEARIFAGTGTHRIRSASQLRREIAIGSVSAVELVTQALAQEQEHRSLGAFIHVDAEAAIARAAQLDQTMASLRRAQGQQAAAAELSTRAPLLGLPTAFKDLIPVAGMPLTLGTRAIPVAHPAQDAPLARRVHRAGAVSIGKTQVPELGLHCYSENAVAPAARNPLKPHLTAGGSTGGGAAAVGAGILPLAPGNDGGGSVRIPAAAAGLVGMKPGRGRMPDDDDSAAVHNVATSGPLAHSVMDTALLFDVMAGHRFSTAAAGKKPVVASGPAQRGVEHALSVGIQQLHVGVTTESPFSPDLEVVLADEAVTALEIGIHLMSQSGHRIHSAGTSEQGRRFWPAGYFENFTLLWTSRLRAAGFDDQQRSLLEPVAQHYLRMAEANSRKRIAEAVEALQRCSDCAGDLFGPWDVLLTPMLATAPPEVGWFSSLEPEQNYRQQCLFTPYSSVVNVLGLPAVNVPVYVDREGLSWSVQLIGKPGAEELLLAAAALIERGVQG